MFKLDNDDQPPKKIKEYGTISKELSFFQSDTIFTSVSDPDLCGSVLKWLPWIQINIGNTDLYPGQLK